jgi:hypothetical protein
MRAQAFADETFPRRWIWAILACALLLAPESAAGQSLVRMTRGVGVAVYPGDQRVNIGQTRPRQPPPGISIAGDPVAEICCSRGSRASCVTERQVALGASSSSVLRRYGRPASQSGRELRYPGLMFGLDGSGQVERICVQRR